MEGRKVIFPNNFFLLSFSEFPWLEKPLSKVDLVSNILTLVGNSSIILLSLVDPRLQKSMYFLDNISLLYLSLTCTIVLQLVANLWGSLLPEFPWLERPLFAVVLVSYILTLLGNSSIIFLSLVDPRLQTPMYFFLDNLSVLDLSLTCTTVPQLLANLWEPDKTIAAWGCITQLYIYTWVGTAECALLAVMAIDRYVAVCRPLHYTLIMRPWVCVQMAAVCWSSGLANALLQATLTLQLPRCGHHTLDHFFCEASVLIKLACGDTSANELALTLMTIPFGMMPPLLVLISYTFIARAVLKLPSAEGRRKALSTCSSHLLVVTLFFAPGMYLYLQPSSKSSQAKFISFFCCVITPLLNPLIYTLRNKDVQTARKRILQSQASVKSFKAK
ncbi:Olfactory receptor 15 [Fukomys damarensis]|uniref:Olfactory receptor n=1 Tax=Fukomys damarensis TaxID=885580 RepID=A0A091DYZ2_FUKDA|nr:Olfactory receptor 15 [Fukomys damarensis]